MKPCIVCGAPSNGPRCPNHQTPNTRPNPARRGYDAQWRKTASAVLKRDHSICHICGRPGATSVDHITPKAKGGTDHMTNLAAAHIACNSQKGAR
jgi:5-methylcytosine-specific restriction endonuclease McrA